MSLNCEHCGAPMEKVRRSLLVVLERGWEPKRAETVEAVLYCEECREITVVDRSALFGLPKVWVMEPKKS